MRIRMCNGCDKVLHNEPYTNMRLTTSTTVTYVDLCLECSEKLGEYLKKNLTNKGVTVPRKSYDSSNNFKEREEANAVFNQ